MKLIYCRVDQCDVKSSKKRPLLLVWTNPDPMAHCFSSDFQIIFKTGDGLSPNTAYNFKDNVFCHTFSVFYYCLCIYLV